MSIDRIQQLKAKVRQNRQTKQVVVAEISKMDAEQQKQAVLQYQDLLEALDREYRVTRSEYDILFFTYEYFSDDCNPDNDDNLIPVGVSITDAPAFHMEICNMITELEMLDPTKKICWAAPRNHAKTVYLSNITPIHAIVFKKKRYIVVLSETVGMAKQFVSYVGNQLKYNKKLRDDFGAFLHPEKIRNAEDNLDGFVTTSNTKVQVASIGKQLRGARHLAERPDLIICDDLESRDNINTKELRDKNLHWYNSVIVPLGTPEKTGIIYMGTLVHGQGLLPNILSRAEYDSKIYSAIVSEPDNMALWQQYEEILLDTDNPDRLIQADNFYFKHQQEMDEGCQTLWESRFPYKELIKKKVEIGTRAFSSEYLNKPSDSDSQIFSPDRMSFYDDSDLFDKYGKPLPLELFSFWDIAIGKNSRSDYNAIVTIGRDRRTGVIYVLDAWAQKIALHKASDVAYQKIIEHKPRVFGVEAVQAQFEMYRQLQQRAWKAGLYGTRLKPVNPKGKKEERIEILEPLIENGMLRLRKDQRLLIEQLEQFPNGDHDDLPDALASVVNLAGSKVRRTYQRKPAGL